MGETKKMKLETIQRRRREIFDAAIEVFAKKGFEKATLDEIAEHLKISKPAIYLYFKNKETLFFSMFQDKINNIQINIEDILHKKVDSIQKLKEFIMYEINFFTQNKQFFNLINNSMGQIDFHAKSKIRDEFINSYKNLIKRIALFMKQCIKEGYLINQNEYFLTFSLMGLIQHNIFNCMMFNQWPDLKGMDDKVLNLFLKGAGR